MHDLRIANGGVVTPDTVYKGDILVQNGRIALVGDGSGVPSRETLDATGMLLFPGMIDSHAHLNDPGFTWREDFPHGSAAAAVGGVTTIVDMPLQNRPALTNAEVFTAKERAVAGRSHTDYAFWGGLIDTNLADLEELDRSGAVAFKAFIGPVSPDYAAVDLGHVRNALRIMKRFDGLVGFHCEDFSIIKAAEADVANRLGDKADWRDFLDSRPLSAEIIATRGVIELARETGARVHICHVSHPDVAELVRQARLDGLPVSGETCCHYLAYSDEDVMRNGSLFKCAPPLRTAGAREKLWRYVADGTLGCLGSDHSPCRADEKDEREHGVMGAWGGISGIQSMMQVLYDQGVVRRGNSPTLLARIARDTAEIFSLGGAKGAIRPGLDADIVVFDPNKEWEITPASLRYLNRISAFTGLKGRGLPVCTLVRGNIVAKDGEVVGSLEYGRLVKRNRI